MRMAGQYLEEVPVLWAAVGGCEQLPGEHPAGQ
jgi:hypothetical protein